MKSFSQALLWSSPAAIFIGFLFTDPITQDGHYHQFANDLTLFGINHFWNVITNLPFIGVGLYGLHQMAKHDLYRGKEQWLMLGFVAVGFGSGFYHNNPTSLTLFWDRLPMAFVFSTLFVIVLGEFGFEPIRKRFGNWIIAFSIFTVFYWIIGDIFGKGDLRLYGLVQGIPMLAIPVILFFKGGNKPTQPLWYALGFYALAKFFEFTDGHFFEVTHFMGGHPIKHLCAAASMYWVYRFIMRLHLNKQKA